MFVAPDRRKIASAERSDTLSPARIAARRELVSSPV
jgi:hypothetical protein